MFNWDGNFFAGAAAVVWLILALAQLVLFIAALIAILASKRYTGGGKFLWILFVFAWPLVGPLGWFFFGRRAQIRREPIMDKR